MSQLLAPRQADELCGCFRLDLEEMTLIEADIKPSSPT